MPRILLLLPTTTYRTQAFMEAAGRLGVQVTVGSEEPSTMTALNPAGFLTLDFVDPAHAVRQVIEFSARYPIAAVVSVDDQATTIGAAICQALGFPANSVESARAARSKFPMRELLARAGVPQPRYRLCSFADDPAGLGRQVEYPCVVKPLALAGSQGVIRANDEAEFVAAVRRLEHILKDSAFRDRRTASQSEDREGEAPAEPCFSAVGGSAGASPSRNLTAEFLVEEFIPGAEVAVEGLLTGGELRVLAIFDKPDPLEGPFFEETIYLTPSRLPSNVQQSITDCAARACRAIGLTHGPIHAELRLRETGTHGPPSPFVIEVNPRSIGGLCSRVLKFGAGLSLEELIIRQAIDANFVPPSRAREAAGVMMIPIPEAGVFRAVQGLDAARAIAGIEGVVISVHNGQKLVPLPERSVYLGFIFARGPTPDQVEAALRTAHAQLKFYFEPVF